MPKKSDEPTQPKNEEVTNETCPKCGSPLGEVVTTKTGKQFQRCSTGSWNRDTKEVEGCDFIRWLDVPPQELDEKCPKCGSPLILTSTKFGKKMKKCSTNKWDPATRQATGCDYVEWIKGTTEELDEECPTCGAKLVLFTTANGKRLKKCSTNKWDKDQKMAVGCAYVEWL